ncbi:MAG: cytochrome c3 family protein [Candidatus Marinimicrobia bacterium]|nr:cytochrome c3 family protein [Candidatus Neomarinimicrobiota bacterium]
MRLLTFFLLIGFISQIAVAEVDINRDACIQCHVEIDDDLDNPVMTNYENDIHYEKGLSCSDCHGGNPEGWDDEDAAMYDNDSFIEDMSKMDEVNMCGKCHADPTYMRQYAASVKTDQLAQYWTSQHGIKLQEGIDNVASCTSCHNVHGIFPVNDPRSTVYDLNIPETCSKCHSDADIMKDSGYPTDQFDDFKISVHGIALLENQDIGSPACNDCHGNHGASPPDVGHISDICGTCHVNNKELFQSSHLKDAFIKEGIAQCEGCHNNHAVEKTTDEYLNWENNSVCIVCHENDDKGSKAVIMADSFYEIIMNLKSGIHMADSLLNDAEQKGMEVSDYDYNLEEAHRTLIQTRTAIHSFNLESVIEVATPGMKAIEASLTGANKVLNDWIFRRKGLFVFSLIISFVALILYIKIRDMEKPD